MHETQLITSEQREKKRREWERKEVQTYSSLSVNCKSMQQEKRKKQRKIEKENAQLIFVLECVYVCVCVFSIEFLMS